MFEPIKNSYRKPTLGELLGHIFVGPRGEHVVPVTLPTIYEAFAVVGSVLLVLQGHPDNVVTFMRDAAAGFIAINAIALGVPFLMSAGGIWFLGMEGWSPEYEAQQNRDQRRMNGEIIPPQL